MHICPQEIAALMFAVPALLVVRAWLADQWRKLRV